MGFMPSFHKTNAIVLGDTEAIGNVEMEASPLGFRGIPLLRWLLHLVPYITGSKPNFRIRVVSSVNRPFNIVLKRKVDNKSDSTVLTSEEITTNRYSADVQDIPISNNSQFSYTLLAYFKGAHAEAELINFKSQYQETITMWIFGFAVAILAAGFGSIITWLFTRTH